MSSQQQSEREISGQLDIRAATVNEDARTVDAVLSTERAVEMWDWRSGGMIDEVLLADGVELPRQLPLLDTHSRYRLSDVLGSIRNIRQEGSDTVGTLHFASGDDEVDRVWNKVRQGHLTDVSVGYRVTEYIDIQPDSKASVNGREFAAGNRPMRVATKWKLREASMVPIGADEAAKLRQQGELTMAKPNDAPVVADAERQVPPEKPAEQREARGGRSDAIG